MYEVPFKHFVLLVTGLNVRAHIPKSRIITSVS